MIDRVFSRLSRPPMIYFITGSTVAIYLPMFSLMRRLEELGGAPIPDVTPLHGAADLSAMFAAWGTTGQADYARFGRYDLFLPLVLAALLGSLIYTVWQGSTRRNLAWIPIAASVADYAENFIVHGLASNPTDVDETLATISGILTTVKFLGLAAAVVVIGWGWFDRRRAQQQAAR